MDNAQLNSVFASAARWRLRHDFGLARACAFSRLNPVPHTTTGHLLLRRWRGTKAPRPTFAATIGFARRPDTVVDEGAGVTWADDAVYWLAADRVNAGAICSPVDHRAAQPVVRSAGDDVGLLPNPPVDVTLRQGGDGKLWISWGYNPAGQQAVPALFAIYSDAGGGGALDGDPLATVPYVAGRIAYTWRYSGDDWDQWRFLVLAETTGGVKSLATLPNGRGLSTSYGLAAMDAILTARRCVSTLVEPGVFNALSGTGQT